MDKIIQKESRQQATHIKGVPRNFEKEMEKEQEEKERALSKNARLVNIHVRSNSPMRLRNPHYRTNESSNERSEEPRTLASSSLSPPRNASVMTQMNPLLQRQKRSAMYLQSSCSPYLRDDSSATFTGGRLSGVEALALKTATHGIVNTQSTLAKNSAMNPNELYNVQTQNRATDSSISPQSKAGSTDRLPHEISTSMPLLT